MKHLYLSILGFLLFTGDQLSAQYAEFKSGILARKTFYDYNTLRDKDAAAFKDYQNGFELGYIRNLKNNISLLIPIGAGVFRDSASENTRTAFYSIGAQAQVHFGKTDRWANPFITSGIQALFPKKGDLAVQIPLGIGIQFMVHPQVYLHWQSDYRLNIANWEDHIQHNLGFVFFLGNKKMKKDSLMTKPDSDGDGIIDELDLCPNIPGLAQFTGCPDSDGDGIEDPKDKCPEMKGLPEFKGCPDTDEDSVPDHEDECPNIKGTAANKGCPDADSDGDGVFDQDDLCPDKAGLKEMKGCPDSDGDGISDLDDKCPMIAGPVSNGGCPQKEIKDSDNDKIPDDQDECPFTAGLAALKGCPDTDGDGVMDKIDNCPSSPGPASNKGCPIIEKADKETLDFAMRAVQFDLGRATLKSESFSILDKVVKILKKYPDYNLIIAGHTDNTGSAKFNLDLSDRRAKVCYEYLISQGIPVSRLSYSGYGSTKPISSNANETGRFLNRRVEFNLVPR